MFPWLYGSAPPKAAPTPRELLLRRLSEGVPPELATKAAGLDELDENDPEIKIALAEGQIALFERARDSGVTGTIRAAMRYEAKSWQPKAETPSGMTLEDYLRD